MAYYWICIFIQLHKNKNYLKAKQHCIILSMSVPVRRGRILHSSFFKIIEEKLPEIQDKPSDYKMQNQKKKAVNISEMKNDVEKRIDQVEHKFGKVCPVLAKSKSRKAIISATGALTMILSKVQAKHEHKKEHEKMLSKTPEINHKYLKSPSLKKLMEEYFYKK